MNNHHTAIFQNTWALQQLPATMRLPNIEWRFLLCCDGQTPVHQVQRRLGLAEKERDAILARLCAAGLLTEKAMTLDELARANVDQAAPGNEPQTLSEFLQAGEPAAPAREKAPPAFSPLQKPSTPATPTRAMSLQAVIQFILNQNSDPTAGHLATYQVFMGISTQLLKRNGITSLRFQEDRIITDPELQTAIIENIQKVLKVTCPADAFIVPAAAKA